MFHVGEDDSFAFFSPAPPACTHTETFISSPLRICDPVSPILNRRRLHLLSLRWAVSTLLPPVLISSPYDPSSVASPNRTRTLDALWLCLEPQDVKLGPGGQRAAEDAGLRVRWRRRLQAHPARTAPASRQTPSRPTAPTPSTASTSATTATTRTRRPASSQAPPRSPTTTRVSQLHPQQLRASV